MNVVKTGFAIMLLNCWLCGARADPEISTSATDLMPSSLLSSASLDAPSFNKELDITFSANKVPVIQVEKDIYTQLVAAQADDAGQLIALPKHRSNEYFSEPDALYIVLLLALSVLYKFRLRPKAWSISRN